MLTLIIWALIIWTIGYYIWRYFRELDTLPGLEKKAVFITGEFFVNEQERFGSRLENLIAVCR